MAIQSTNTLKSYFETGDYPTQEQFEALVDSLHHVSEGATITSVNIEDPDIAIFNLSSGESVTIDLSVIKSKLIDSIDAEAGQLKLKAADGQLIAQVPLEDLGIQMSESEAFINALSAALALGQQGNSLWTDNQDGSISSDKKVGVGTTTPNGVVEIINGDSNTESFFISSSATGNAGNIFAVARSKRVGIGTANPVKSLDVRSDSDAIALFNTRSTTGNPRIGLGQNGSEKAWMRYLNNGDILEFNSIYGGFKFSPRNIGVKAVVITKEGDLGIGTQNPDAKQEIINIDPTLDFLRIGNSEASSGNILKIDEQGRLLLGNPPIVGAYDKHIIFIDNFSSSIKNKFAIRGRMMGDTTVYERFSVDYYGKAEINTKGLGESLKLNRVDGAGVLALYNSGNKKGTIEARPNQLFIGTSATNASGTDLWLYFANHEIRLDSDNTKIYTDGQSYQSADNYRFDVPGTQNALSIGNDGKIKAQRSVQVGDDSDNASAANEGAIRYRSDSNNSYVEMCMRTGANSYEWSVIKHNTW